MSHNFYNTTQHSYPQPTAKETQSPASLYHYCKKNMLSFTVVQMNDGSMYEGIIEDADQEHVYMLVPEGEKEQENRDFNGTEVNEEMNRQFGFGGYGGYGGYGGVPFGYGGGYGGFPQGYGQVTGGYYYPRRFRRFRRYRFPFFGIGGFFPPFFF